MAEVVKICQPLEKKFESPTFKSFLEFFSVSTMTFEQSLNCQIEMRFKAYVLARLKDLIESLIKKFNPESLTVIITAYSRRLATQNYYQQLYKNLGISLNSQNSINFSEFDIIKTQMNLQLFKLARSRLEGLDMESDLCQLITELNHFFSLVDFEQTPIEITSLIDQLEIEIKQIAATI